MSYNDQNDSTLSRRELVTYGIGYEESSDSLYIGQRFVKNPDLAVSFMAHVSPSLALRLLYSPCGGSLVGVQFTSISMLIEHYWNGKIPEPCPLNYFADLADLCIADPRSILLDLGLEVVERVAEMHRLARRLVGEEVMPDSILERLRDNDYEKALTH